MQIIRTNSVFVPGGLPQYTYVSRSEGAFEARLRQAQDNLCKLVTVTGATKSGKTVLTNRVFPRETSVWIDGGSCDTEDDLWAQVVEKLDVFTHIESEVSSGKSYGIEAGFEAEANAIILKGKGAVTPSWEQTKESSTRGGRSIPSKSVAIEGLRKSRIPLIIDDFHYLKRDLQGSIVRAIKSLVFEGHPIVFLAIPHRRYDAVRVEREMTGRVDSVTIPTWEKHELLDIPNQGFSLLNAQVPPRITVAFADEALGSPHLMQEFCRQLCHRYGIIETLPLPQVIPQDSELSEIFREVAKTTTKVMFDRLAKGPRSRTDRKQRRLRDGHLVDIYNAMLLAIARLKPGMQTLEYESIRASLREVLSENIPQAHEISRVLDHMAKISADDEASTPVIDWEKDDRKLHITDPFFAFFLKWGLEPGTSTDICAT